MKRRAAQSGVTLMELLIAITLVSMLTTGMLFAMRVGLDAMNSTQRRIEENRRLLGAHRVLEQEFGGFMPAVAHCGIGAMGMSPPVPFFQGEPTVMRFVSAYSLLESWRGLPVVVELFVAPATDGKGMRLLMNQFPYRGPVGAGSLCGPPVPGPLGAMPSFPPPVPRAVTYVLADHLSRCQFSYKIDLPNVPQQWLPGWQRPDRWPRAVRIDMLSLDMDASRVQPMPATFPIYVDKPPMEPNVLY